MKRSIVYVGADVSKSEVVWCIRGKTVRCVNTPKELTRVLTSSLVQGEQIQVICESSGGYERPLLQACAEQKVAVSRLEPGRIRHHALAKGQLAKTDPIDARMLVSYGEAHQPEPTPSASQEQRVLTALRERAEQIKGLILSEQNRLQQADLPEVRRSLQRTLRILGKELNGIQRELERRVEANSDWKAKRERMTQVKGVGPLTALALLAHLPELGTLEDGQAAALSGTAPYNRDSGTVCASRSI
jgi:transposase